MYEPDNPAPLGIIPARAGFTQDKTRVLMLSKDHPRSRGVYDDPALNPLWHKGSSPLARGLPINEHDRRGDPRIIPARAGFTNTLMR